MKKVVNVTRLNAIPIGYKFGLHLQDAIVELRKLGQMGDTILLLEVIL